MTKNEFYEKWLEHFSIGISKQDLKKYVVSTGNYLWHVFSWELLEEKKFLVGDQAGAAYDKADKRGAIYIEWFQDEKTHDITWDLNTADALDNMVEVYVVARDFSWTYIKTHEGMCGPYFMKI
ncbi:MAG: DUF4275 family protein [Clostridia bacterium]|nr:DUF4275 family protein [Clostridia bacterium]